MARKKKLPDEFKDYQFALPDKLGVPSDALKCRLDFYNDTIMLYLLEGGVIHSRQVSAMDIAQTLLSEINLSSGLLPHNTLWWSRHGIGLYRPPQIWKVALAVKAFEGPRRFALPMPGLVFECYPARAPRVFAVKKRPSSMRDNIYHAPLFNVFGDGRTCPGTHKFPPDITLIPESFFTSFFSMEANYRNRSKSHPDSLFSLWEEIDGKKRFPTKDLMKAGILGDILK